MYDINAPQTKFLEPSGSGSVTYSIRKCISRNRVLLVLKILGASENGLL